MAEQGKRIRQFHLTPQQVAQAFDPAGPPHVHVRGLPDGYKVEFCDYDVQAHSFQFIVSHPTFPVVDPGVSPPELQIGLTIPDEE